MGGGERGGGEGEDRGVGGKVWMAAEMGDVGGGGGGVRKMQTLSVCKTQSQTQTQHRDGKAADATRGCRNRVWELPVTSESSSDGHCPQLPSTGPTCLTCLTCSLHLWPPCGH